ncbi:hypothetical protein NL676_034141 [Syzygium grande]|nr:hypothetical protein NL676_034141 [Syzygium grande]
MLASRSFHHRARPSSPAAAALLRRLLSARSASAQPPPPPTIPTAVAAAAAAAEAEAEADDRRRGLASGTLLQLLSSVALGSGLGIAYWRCASEGGDGLKPLVAFADSSAAAAAAAESAVDDRRLPSLFRKLSLPDYSPKYLFGDAYRRKVFFNYEKRIRLRSPPEKVFEYFASFRTPAGEILMKPADLMRAVVPVFPPSESHLVRDGF